MPAATEAHTLSPATLGYRMPAEWAPHAGTWISWPHNRETWPHQLALVEATFVEMVAALAPHETVHINVRDARHERHVRATLDAAHVPPRVKLHTIPTDDAWIRDYGAIFVKHADAAAPQTLAATAWAFNSWGEKYPPWHHDDAVAAHMAAALEVPSFEHNLVLEGGSIDTDGNGLLLTTEACLLNPNRGSHRTRAALEQTLCTWLGAEHVLWLGDGIAGDDTDGHIDDLARFVAPGTVVTVVEDDPQDENYEALQENLARLHAFRLPGGQPLRVHTLPMPAPVVIDGERMPASYANFYVANHVVLLPAYDDPADEKAAATLQRCFPTRTIVPIDCRAVIWGLGALHCLTQQVPA